VRYVDVNSTDATPPYTNWATAAASSQQTVDAAAPGDDIVVTNGASLFGFTLTNGATRSAGDWEREQKGGGVWCESTSATVSNRTLISNSAGGGGGVLGWGLPGAISNNCIACFNQAPDGANYLEAVLEYSCTTPLPTNGVGNINADPRFVDATISNFRLRVERSHNLVNWELVATVPIPV